MTGTYLALLALAGLAIGSFVNVVAYRVPIGKSIVRPPSTCPGCGELIRPRDNIPVVGWILLGGKCRECGGLISPRYPIVELTTGALFALLGAHIGLQWKLPAFLWFGGLTMTLLLTDLDHKRIPNAILIPGGSVAAILLALGAMLDGELPRLARAFAGGTVFFAGLLLLAIVTRGGFGMGDVKLAFLLGLFTAYESWIALGTSVFLAFLLGGLGAIALLASGKKARKDAVPFGPALILGSWLAIAVSSSVATWLNS